MDPFWNTVASCGPGGGPLSRIGIHTGRPEQRVRRDD